MSFWAWLKKKNNRQQGEDQPITASLPYFPDRQSEPIIHSTSLRKYHSISKFDDLDQEYLQSDSHRPPRLLSTQSQDLSYFKVEPKKKKNFARRLSNNLIEKLKTIPFPKKSPSPSTSRESVPTLDTSEVNSQQESTSNRKTSEANLSLSKSSKPKPSNRNLLKFQPSKPVASKPTSSFKQESSKQKSSRSKPLKAKLRRNPLIKSMSALSDRPYLRSSLGSNQPPPQGPPPNQVWLISKGYVETAEGQIHYRRCGDGPPVVLLLHNSPSSSAMFTSAMPRMAAKGTTCIALDLPNAGESYGTKSEPTLDDLTNAVMTSIHKLGFAFPFNIVGHQSGASLALHLAVEYPNLISKLALWGIPIIGIIGRGDILREESPDYANELTDIINTYILDKYPAEGYPWQLKVRGLIDMLQTYDRRFWGNRPTALVDAEGLLKKIKQPVLCMAGSREVYQKSTMKAAVLLQTGKYLELGPAGGDVVDEFPDDFVHSIVEFFKVSGMPLERSSCTIPSSLSPLESAWLQRMGNRFDDIVVKKMGVGVGVGGGEGDGKDGKAERMSSSRRSSRTSGEEVVAMELARSDSKSTESDSRRSSTEKKTRMSLKNLVKGKFLS